MKRGIWGRTLTGIAALCLVASVATAKDAFVGNWDMDVAKSTLNGQAGYKSGHVSITAAKGTYKSVVDLVPMSGAALHYEYSYKFDGSDSPVTGNASFDSATMLRTGNTVIRTERRAGKVVGMTTIEIAKDGKSFSSSSKGTGADGKPYTRALSWDRVKK
jgi:hypothetical protein